MGRNGRQPPPLHAFLTIREIPDPIKKGRDTMNIFTHRDSFYGCTDSGVKRDSLLSLWGLAKQIRLRLGRQGYLLDCYLSLFFDGIGAGDTAGTTLRGIELGGEIQRLLYQVMDGTESGKQHPLYPRIREVYEQQKDSLIFQEKHTNFCLLQFYLADELMNYYISLFLKEQEDNYVGVDDMVRFRSLYNQISRLAGASLMEELNRRLQQHFLIAPLASSFAQGLTCDLIFKLSARDPQTSRQMFQLLLDSMPESR